VSQEPSRLRDCAGRTGIASSPIENPQKESQTKSRQNRLKQRGNVCETICAADVTGRLLEKGFVSSPKIICVDFDLRP
jgi:hypothetical protein